MTLLHHRDRIEGDLVIEVAFTDVSLSLGDAAEDDVRAEALRQVAEATMATPVLMHQVHGADTVRVADRGRRRPRTCDALYTSQPEVALLARAADCVPVLLADPATGWIAAVHCGRPGLVAGVVPAAIAAVRDAGGSPSVAWIGPHVCGACYEVPADLQEQVAAIVPASRSTTSWGTPALDLGAGVRAQLGGGRHHRRPGRRRLHARGPQLAVVPPRRCGRHPFRRRDLEPPDERRAATSSPPTSTPYAAASPRACDEAGRADDDVALVVVTKFFPASDVRLLAELGVTDVGENRHQEAEAKAAECADLGLRWHFIGGLQSNKAAAVASYADVVESVDRAKLVGPLSRGAHARGHEVDVLLQVSLDPPGSGGRSGADPADLDELARRVEEAGMLRLRGLMAVAPLGRGAPGRLRPAGVRARRPPVRASRRDRAVGGDERRPGGGRSGTARHTCVSGPRSSVRGLRSSNVDNVSSGVRTGRPV